MSVSLSMSMSGHLFQKKAIKQNQIRRNYSSLRELRNFLTILLKNKILVIYLYRNGTLRSKMYHEKSFV